MPTRSPRHLRLLLRPEPWLAALVALGMLVSGGGAEAAAIAAASIVKDDHGASCDCGARCRGAACCCGPTEDDAATESESHPAPKRAGPCLGAAPCGDPVAPASPAVSVEGKSAALVFRLEAPAPASARLRVRRSAAHLPAVFPSRLERPPEAPASA